MQQHNVQLNMTMKWRKEGKSFSTHAWLPPTSFPTCHGTFFHYRMTTLFFLTLYISPSHRIVEKYIFHHPLSRKSSHWKKSLRKLKETLVFFNYLKYFLANRSNCFVMWNFLAIYFNFHSRNFQEDFLAHRVVLQLFCSTHCRHQR